MATRIAPTTSSGSPATSCVSRADTSQESSSDEGSRKSVAPQATTTTTTTSSARRESMKKGGGNGGGGGGGGVAAAAMAPAPSPTPLKKQQQQQQGGFSSAAVAAHQQACLVASLQAEAVRQQQVVSTTFVEADTSSFRELVQKLTGMAEDAQDKMPITLPARHANRDSTAHHKETSSSSVAWDGHRDGIPMYSSTAGGMGHRDGALMMLDDRGFVRSSVSQEAFANWEKMIAGRNLPGGLNNVDAYRTIGKVEPLAVRRSAFKMPVGKKLELKQGSSLRRDAVANAMFPNYWNNGGYPGVSPRSDVLRSPVTTLTRDPFDSHSFGPGTPSSYETSSVTSLSPRFGHEGCSPRTPGSPYDHGLNIIDKRTRSLVQDVAQEFASCSMGPAGNGNDMRILAHPEQQQQQPHQQQQEYVLLHPPLERRNGEPQLLTLFPLQPEKA